MTMGSSFGSGSSSCKPGTGVSDQFPAGLRVLVVDDDVTCLRILEQMLRRCLYHVTTCSQATAALNLLRERKGCFDVVLSDVHMPDMDGFKLLELVGLEMDLPVIMMSADGRTNLVLRGIRHGACDYLIKPIREEQLKNIWQHVIRKKWNGNKEYEHSGSLDDNKDRHKRGRDETDHASSVNEGVDPTNNKKRRNVKEEEDCEVENDDPGSSKKPRVVWSVELHQQFVSAVNQLGIDKAVPKRILELMNVPGLTRENVASHLQKFRLYLKRLSGVAQQQGSVPNSFCGPIEQNPKLHSYARYDIQSLAASGQIPPAALAAVHAELLGRPTGNIGFPEASISSNMMKQMPQPPMIDDNVHSGLGGWHSNNLVGNYGGLGGQNGHNVLMGMLQKQSITVQPSRLVVPTQQSDGFSVNRSSVIDYGPGQRSDGDAKATAGSVDVGDKTGSQVQICFSETGQGLDHGHLRNLGFVGNGALFPTRFAVYEGESPASNLNHGGKMVKQEPSVEVLENSRASGIAMTQLVSQQRISQNDRMRVFSE